MEIEDSITFLQRQNKKLQLELCEKNNTISQQNSRIQDLHESLSSQTELLEYSLSSLENFTNQKIKDKKKLDLESIKQDKKNLLEIERLNELNSKIETELRLRLQEVNFFKHQLKSTQDKLKEKVEENSRLENKIKELQFEVDQNNESFSLTQEIKSKLEKTLSSLQQKKIIIRKNDTEIENLKDLNKNLQLNIGFFKNKVNKVEAELKEKKDLIKNVFNPKIFTLEKDNFKFSNEIKVLKTKLRIEKLKEDTLNLSDTKQNTNLVTGEKVLTNLHYEIKNETERQESVDSNDVKKNKDGEERSNENFEKGDHQGFDQANPKKEFSDILNQNKLNNDSFTENYNLSQFIKNFNERKSGDQYQHVNNDILHASTYTSSTSKELQDKPLILSSNYYGNHTPKTSPYEQKKFVKNNNVKNYNGKNSVRNYEEDTLIFLEKEKSFSKKINKKFDEHFNDLEVAFSKI
ncbi:hypothetical protein HK099_007441 [Clydaea vesicula]|uniref:Uncharacterized protein n=1 Tax=Clydaea vesicula TaxID=447962 RepID=A0AAD5XY34_9FUNG|nr:hypothetical protein HK099_007441 [Clydaea vesicula]